uniref:Reelin domain-containing protein n=1 Tax=Anopheles maculatus TaxID=74869 RepID=A0A182SIV1_9DIPT
MPCCSFRTTTLALAVLWLTAWPVQVASNGDFSYFYGTIAPTDTLCAKKVVGIGTKTPVQVDYSSKRPITAVSLDASNVAYQGFNALITRGAIGQQGITFSLNGPWVLPYYIELDYYCRAP